MLHIQGMPERESNSELWEVGSFEQYRKRNEVDNGQETRMIFIHGECVVDLVKNLLLRSSLGMKDSHKVPLTFFFGFAPVNKSSNFSVTGNNKQE